MVSKLEETLEALDRARKASPSAIVAFSGGKDSLVVMDLACRKFDRVIGLFKYLVPGLRCVDEMLAAASKRWKVKFLQYPSQNAVNAWTMGLYCDPHEGLPQLSSWAVYAAAIRDTGIPMVLTGMKRSDSQSRRRLLKWNKAHEQVIHPIAGWQKIDVRSYLRVQGIPIPDSSGHQTSGIELVADELLFLHDRYPDDFAKVARYFKYVTAVVERRRIYGPAVLAKRQGMAGVPGQGKG